MLFINFRSVDMESSLLGAELSTQLGNIEELRARADQLRAREADMCTKLSKWRERAAAETAEARGRLSSIEAELERLEAEQGAGQGLLDTDKVNIIQTLLLLLLKDKSSFN